MSAGVSGEAPMDEFNFPQTGSPMLVTKLHRSRASAALVTRPRLLEELTAGLSQRLTLISAPAGYGKTTLVNQWLDSLDRPSAWISLDEHDGDLATFLSYFLAAVRSVYPDAGRTSELLLRAPHLPSPDRLADSFLHDLLALPGPLILVLDDFHVIQTIDVHVAMARLVQYMPAHVHLVLTTRADPPLPLERLRGRQELTEIRSADLRFTLEEAGQLLRQVLGAAATDETTALLEESTEGWAVGLQLAAISLRHQNDPVAFAQKAAQSSHQLITDYLVAEALEGLPEAQKACLLQTSLLDRFCIPLCDAIRGDVHQELTGEDFVRAVRQSNLFVIPLDDEGIWFRYHHFFQHLLRNRLRQFYLDAEIRKLHARASAWFAAHGLLDEAIVHAVKAGDVLRAATLVEDQVHPSLDREDWGQVERWIGLLPADALNRPRLLVAQAWLRYIRFQLPAVVTLLDTAESAMPSEPASIQANETTLRGEISTLRAAIAYSRNDIQSTVQLAEAAMQQLRPKMQYALGQANYFYICGLQAMGQHTAAVEFAHRQLEEAYGRQANSLAMRLLLALSSIHYETAELSALRAVATTLQQLAHQTGLGLSVAWAHCILGWVHYQRNELASAEQYFRNLVPIAHAAHGRTIFDGCTGLVLTALAQGRAHEALTDIAFLRELLLERGMLAFGPIVESLQQRVLLVREPSSALNWRYNGRTTQVPVDFWEQPVITQVRTLLARGHPDDLAQAAELLADSRARAKARSTIRRLIEVEALEALVTLARGDEAAALAALRQAVELAAPGGALRLLVDCGPGIIGLLQKLQTAGVAPRYVQQVLAAFDSPAVPVAALIPSQDSKGGFVGPDTRVETRALTGDSQKTHGPHLSQARRGQPSRRRRSGSPLGFGVGCSPPPQLQYPKPTPFLVLSSVDFSQ
jgi:LuxR family maltose regulon positive regulatory protein